MIVFSWLMLFLLGLVLLAVPAAIILLLSHRKTRMATLVVLGVLGFVAMLLLSFLVVTRTTAYVSQPVQVQPRASVRTVPPPAVKPPTPPPADAAAKREEELSQAVATKTVGFLRVMVRALGRALAEEEQILAAKKGTAKPLPSPGPHEATPRPAWVDAPPQLVGDAYQMSIAIGPYTTRAECDAKLPEALQEALGHYVEVCLGDQVAGDIQLPADYLSQQLVKAQWEEIRQHSVGPMTWLHVLLQFDRKLKDRVLEEHRQAVIARRLQLVGAWAALGLSLLTVAFGYLKIDLATGGAYRGRLQLAAAAAILGLVAVVVAVMA